MSYSDWKQNKQRDRVESNNASGDEVPCQGYEVLGQPDSDSKKNEVPGQTDIVVVVGDKEFTASSHLLCYYSEYFRAAYSGGSKEAETGRFEFPDGDPNEWGLMMPLLNPFSGARVSFRNFYAAMYWFDFLDVSEGLKECYKFLTMLTYSDLTVMLVYLEKSLKHNLARSKSAYFDAIKSLYAFAHQLIESTLDTILDLVLNYKECRDVWWPSLEQYLPKAVSKLQEQNVLVCSGVLRQMILGHKSPTGPIQGLCGFPSPARSTGGFGYMCTFFPFGGPAPAQAGGAFVFDSASSGYSTSRAPIPAPAFGGNVFGGSTFGSSAFSKAPSRGGFGASTQAPTPVPALEATTFLSPALAIGAPAPSVLGGGDSAIAPTRGGFGASTQAPTPVPALEATTFLSPALAIGAPAPSGFLGGDSAIAPTRGGFGASSQAPTPVPALEATAFGSPALAFGAPAPSGFWGGDSAVAPTRGVFGAPTQAPTRGVFGAPTQAPTRVPALGATFFGSPASAFGAPAPSGSIWGDSAAPALGRLFGAPPAMVPGQLAPTQAPTPVPALGATFFGSPAPAFGPPTPSGSIQGGSAAPTFGGFGAPSAMVPGQLAPTQAPTLVPGLGVTAFGSPAPAFGAPAPSGSIWGDSAAPALGGLFGAPPAMVPGHLVKWGTLLAPFQPNTQKDGDCTVTMESISAMAVYGTKSFEELRFEDYMQGNKGSANFFAKTSTSGFGY
jgi:BTB/POZ domain